MATMREQNIMGNECMAEDVVREGFSEEMSSRLRWELQGVSHAKNKANSIAKALREEGALNVSKTQGPPWPEYCG